MRSSDIKYVGINLVKPTKFFLCGIKVNIFIPLPNRTCSNWDNCGNELDNIGVIYRGQQVTLSQLMHIIKCFESVPSRSIHDAFKVNECTFDGHILTPFDINEIKRILNAVERKKPRDRYGDKRGFKQDEKLVL